MNANLLTRISRSLASRHKRPVQWHRAPGRRVRVPVFLLILLAFALLAMPAGTVRADIATTTVSAGTNPGGVAVNPVTNKI